MREREDDSQKWFDLATDSEAEEAQKSYFFDNLNWYCFPFLKVHIRCIFRNYGVVQYFTCSCDHLKEPPANYGHEFRGLLDL